MHQTEEELLVLAAQDGSDRAFSLLFRRYQKPLLRYALKVCGDGQNAQDAVQEAWLKLAKNIRQLDDPRTFKTWIYRLVHWSCIDLLRTTKHSKFHQDLTDDIGVTAHSANEQYECQWPLILTHFWPIKLTHPTSFNSSFSV